MLGTKCLCRAKVGTMFFVQVQVFELVQSLFHCFTVIFAEELACSKQLKILVVDVTNIGAQNWLFLCFKKCNYSNSNNNNSNNNSNNNNNNNNIIIIIIIIMKIFTNNE